MKIPDLFSIEDASYAMDGGSIYLQVLDVEYHMHDVLLTQHMLPEWDDEGRLPGRLYFDDEIIPVRSDSETALIRTLRSASIPRPGWLFQILRRFRRPKDQPKNISIIGSDLKEYYSAMSQGPDIATRYLIDRLVNYVESTDYASLAENQPTGGNHVA